MRHVLLRSGTPLPNMVLQHVDEGAFQWLLRDRAARSMKHTRAHLVTMERRLSAHLEGIALAGVYGIQICLEHLPLKNPGELFTLGATAIRLGDTPRWDHCLGLADGEALVRGLWSALGYTPLSKAEPFLRALLASEDPVQRIIGMRAAFNHGLDIAQTFVPDAVRDPNDGVRATALELLGRTGCRNRMGLLRDLSRDGPSNCRFWAHWSAVLLGENALLSGLTEWVSSDNDQQAESACDLVMRCLPPVELESWHRQIVRAAKGPRASGIIRSLVLGCMASGDSRWIPWLIDLTRDKDLARVAGFAIETITGVDLTDARLDAAGPPEPSTETVDSHKDMESAQDIECEFPDPERLRQWWDHNKARFPTGTRYLRGERMTEASLQKTLTEGTQWQRHHAALERMVRGKCLVLVDPGRLSSGN